MFIQSNGGRIRTNKYLARLTVSGFSFTKTIEHIIT